MRRSPLTSEREMELAVSVVVFRLEHESGTLESDPGVVHLELGASQRPVGHLGERPRAALSGALDCRGCEPQIGGHLPLQPNGGGFVKCIGSGGSGGGDMRQVVSREQLTHGDGGFVFQL